MPSTSRQKAKTSRAIDSDDSDDNDSGSDFDDTPKPRQTAKMGKPAVSRVKRAVSEDSDSEEEEEEEEEEHLPSSSRNRIRKRSVISEDDDEEEDEPNEDNDVDEEEEEVLEEIDSEDEADMTVIDAALSPVKATTRRPSPLLKRAKLNEEVDGDDSYNEVRISLPTTPTKSSSSEAEERIKALPPKTPDQRLLEVNRAITAPPRPTMTPYTPRNATIAPTPASQARTTAAPPQASVPPKIRLVIHKMVLRDFKSYAGEQIIGPFHKSFSAVVGPNGSGKSNVIDAMLFVFGWRANKMRQGKLSELIHNSAGKENIPHCSVEVWFREIVDLPGPDDFKVVPKSKLVVARTAYRNNSSVYTMNGKKSSFTEVTTLLKTRGIDLDHKRFLILQGEVESIAQMPPKAKTEHEEGLLEYLEDIIGTSSYKTPIEEASKKVDEANELRGERLGRLKIVQKERDSLEPKKREAEAYLRDQNELTQRQSSLWQVYMLECKDQMSIATTSMEKLKQKIEQEREKNAGSKAEIDSLEKSFKKINAEFDSAAKEHEKIVKELAKCEKDDVQLQEKRKHLETKKKKLTKAMTDDKHAISEARSSLANSTEEIETLSKDIKKMEAGLEKEEAELDRIRESLKGKTEKFSIAIDEKQIELQPWIAKISEKENARDVAVEEKKLLTDQFGQAEKEASDAKKALQELEESCETKREEVERLQNEKSQQIEKVKMYKEEIKGMEMQEEELRIKATTSRVKCDEAKASMQSNRSRGDVLSSLSRQAELGMIKGFHGRLGNLGTIDDRYDVAISTACPGLDNIVVDGVEHGQACIEHLRKNNLGRANFILLNSLAKMNMGPIQTPDGVPRLFDLVKPRDARFAPAFYHQLRDTLVARDLNHANKIAYGATRWRVVTLDGQLIDKSGTMSGGGTKVARGAMSSKTFAQEVTLEQLSRFDKERMVNEDALQKQIKYTQDMKGMLESCLSRIPQIEMTLDKIELELGNSQRMIQEAQKRCKEIQQQQNGPGDGDAKRVKELDKVITMLEGEIEKLKRTSTLIESDITALQDQILEAGGVELRAQNSKVEGIKERIDLYNERMTKAEVTKTKAEKDVMKLNKSAEKNTEALTSIESEMEGVVEEIASKSQSVDVIRQKVEQVHYDLEGKKEARDEIKENLDKLMEGANAFRTLEMEIKQKLEEDEKSFDDNERKLHHWEEKHGKLEMQQIDSDEDEEEEEEEEEEEGEIEGGEGEGASDAEANGSKEQVSVDQERTDDQRSKVAKRNDQRVRELQEYSPDELRSMNKENIKAEIALYEEKLQKGQGNLSVLQEYRKRELEFLARAKDLEATTQERDEAKRRHDDLRKQRLESFMSGFSIISSKLKEMYQTITLGGNAELELVDSLDPFSEGILFSVMPPKKSWKNISNLSGGEKTLSSLALVFALHAFKPTPLYAMDELDAALDFRNVSIVANLIKERTKGAQFIVISLRNNMFELASRLVGIYKTNGQTKSLAVHNTDLHALPAPPIAAPMTASRTMHAMTTPRPNMARGSVPPSMTTPAFNQLSSIRRPTSTLQTPARSFANFNIASPVPTSFTQIPQTPKTGMIRGLGITGSSIKLTSSQSIRGDFNNNRFSQFHQQGNSASNSERSSVTPLAVRRPN